MGRRLRPHVRAFPRTNVTRSLWCAVALISASLPGSQPPKSFDGTATMVSRAESRDWDGTQDGNVAPGKAKCPRRHAAHGGALARRRGTTHRQQPLHLSALRRNASVHSDRRRAIRVLSLRVKHRCVRDRPRDRRVVLRPFRFRIVAAEAPAVAESGALLCYLSNASQTLRNMKATYGVELPAMRSLAGGGAAVR